MSDPPYLQRPPLSRDTSAPPSVHWTGVYLLHGLLMAPLARLFELPGAAVHLLPDQ